MNLLRHFLAVTTATILVGLFSSPSKAATIRFGTAGIQFDRDTRINFSFTGSNNFYRSNLKVFIINPDSGYVDRTSGVSLFAESKRSDDPSGGSADGWLGTCGQANSVLSGCDNFFVFRAGLTYTLGLDNFNGSNPGLSPYVYSTNASNQLLVSNGVIPGNTGAPTNGQRAIFGSAGTLAITPEGVAFSNPGSFTSADPLNGPVSIFFEDGGFDARTDGTIVSPNDRDFNDFRILAEAENVPVPGLVAGLLMFGRAIVRRRQQQTKTQENANIPSQGF